MKYYAYFRSYFHDERDSIYEITEEEYNLINPWNNWFAMGGNNDGDPPDEIRKLVWEDIKERTEVDVRVSELDSWDFSHTVEIAIC